MNDISTLVIIGVASAALCGVGIWLIVKGIGLRRLSKQEKTYQGRGEAVIVRIHPREESDDTYYYPVLELKVNDHVYEQEFPGITQEDSYKIGSRYMVAYDIADPSHFCDPDGILSSVDGAVAIGFGILIMIASVILVVTSCL